MCEDPTAAEILEQIGWNRTDTHFMSLSLTKEQLDVVQKVVGRFGAHFQDMSPEECIARILREWLRTNK